MFLNERRRYCLKCGVNAFTTHVIPYCECDVKRRQFSNVHMEYLSNEKSLGTFYYIPYCNSCYKNCKYSCDYHRTMSTKQSVNWIYEQEDHVSNTNYNCNRYYCYNKSGSLIGRLRSLRVMGRQEGRLLIQLGGHRRQISIPHGSTIHSSSNHKAEYCDSKKPENPSTSYCEHY